MTTTTVPHHILAAAGAVLVIGLAACGDRKTGASNPEPLTAIGFDTTLVENLGPTGETMAELRALASVDSDEVKELKLIRETGDGGCITCRNILISRGTGDGGRITYRKLLISNQKNASVPRFVPRFPRRRTPTKRSEMIGRGNPLWLPFSM